MVEHVARVGEELCTGFSWENLEETFGRPRHRRAYKIKINFTSKYNWRVWTRTVTVRNLRVLQNARNGLASS